MLRQGGSATDAAIATMLALTVVEPQSSGIGGGGFLVYDDARRHAGDLRRPRDRAVAATGRPGSSRTASRCRSTQAIPGGKSVGVPGNVRMMALAHRDHGKLPWAALFEPAIRLARDGFAITPRLQSRARPRR